QLGLDLLQGAHLEELLAELAAAGEALRVPPQVLPELDDALLGVALEGDGVPGVLQADGEALEGVGLGGDGAALQGGPGLGEDPGVAVAAPGDHEAVAAGLVAHPPRVLPGPEVPVADDGDLDGLDDGADLVPPRLAGVH